MKILVKSLLLIIYSVCLSTAAAQGNAEDEERQAILAVADAFFEALANRDRAALEAILVPGSLNISTSQSANGDTNYSIRDYQEMVSSLSTPGGSRTERYWDATVLIQGNIAVFWAPYDFHVEGEFSHCGIDSFQLVKQQGRWLLSNLSWTIEPSGCAESPLGPLR
ncbi:MAG: DUF4440 domain-containing protein [Gammaproteobacteria bacterium]|jgi:hypothetical protein|nr:DUF4440 domain-containing protein [Gammaproteobacteria bacterium]MDP6537534.1 DUF4440 domain-containing protein [Gammaproteobacteria bacterium]MDP6733289.1 DUF4440 domain-containing protein [Gammaproteobacteria bacterium]HAJ75695.1 hypothetical protein [Gammaproteobacteria bacterium]|tara:strand:- start:1345 stop:1842 length:498 start_codon:yes stop_codon:yes gene_type:complete